MFYRLAIRAVIVVLGLGLGFGPAPPAWAEGSDAPRAELGEICRRFRAGDNVYYGQAPLERLRRRLTAAETDPLAAILTRVELGRELVQNSHPEEAAEVLDDALTRANAAGVEPKHQVPILHLAALAHLQAAEDVNCRERHNAASCIVPFAKEALHTRPEHAQRAAELFARILELQPRSVQAAWLYNLARQVTGAAADTVPPRYRLPPSAWNSEESFPRWTDRAPALGLHTMDLAGGAVMDDFDGDGLLDLVSSTCDPCGSLKAYRNNGRGGFDNVTAVWGLDAQLGGLNLVHADYDGDGDLDLLVLRGAWLFDEGRLRNSLLRNDLNTEAPAFTDVTRQAGVALPAYPTQTAAWGDYDGDGDLDLYIGNEALPDKPHPSQLFRNDGDGRFIDVAADSEVENLRYAKGVAWGDYDNDGDLDLYVSNFGRNRLYRNDGPDEGDGPVTFTDVAPELGVTRPDERSFATWFFDYDNDGDLDLFVADYQGPAAKVAATYFGVATEGGAPRLYRNEGGERFIDVSAAVGFRRPSMPMGANYGDLDNDGFPDIYLGTGDPQLDSILPNVMLRNDGGRAFRDVTFAGGFGHLQKGHGVAFGDIDQDGDQDLFHQLGGFFPGDAYGNALFENPGPAGRWITLRLEGRRANRFGIGARIEVRVEAAGGRRSIHVVAGSGGSFGGSSLQQEIGLGQARSLEEIRIRWPGSGTVQRFENVEPERIYRVVEGAAELVPVVSKPFRLAPAEAPQAAAPRPAADDLSS